MLLVCVFTICVCIGMVSAHLVLLVLAAIVICVGYVGSGMLNAPPGTRVEYILQYL